MGPRFLFAVLPLELIIRMLLKALSINAKIGTELLISRKFLYFHGGFRVSRPPVCCMLFTSADQYDLFLERDEGSRICSEKVV